MNTPARKFIDVDVMLDDRFVHTFHVSTLLADGVSRDGAPVFSVPRLEAHIESRMPSLKGQHYRICF